MLYLARGKGATSWAEKTKSSEAIDRNHITYIHPKLYLFDVLGARVPSRLGILEALPPDCQRWQSRYHPASAIETAQEMMAISSINRRPTLDVKPKDHRREEDIDPSKLSFTLHLDSGLKTDRHRDLIQQCPSFDA